MLFHKIGLLLAFLATNALLAQNPSNGYKPELEIQRLPSPPENLGEASIANLNNALLLIGNHQRHGKASTSIYVLKEGAQSWQPVGELDYSWSEGATAIHQNSLLLIGGLIDGRPTDQTLRLTVSENGSIESQPLPNLPQPIINAAAVANGDSLWVAGGKRNGSDSSVTNGLLQLDLSQSEPAWIEKDSWAGPARHSAHLVRSIETISFLGGIGANGLPTGDSHSFHPTHGWQTSQSTAPNGVIKDALKLGDSHALALIQNEENLSLHLYHAIGDTWIDFNASLSDLKGAKSLAFAEEGFILVSEDSIRKVALPALQTNYGWYDHISVALYFIALIYVGVHFTKKGKSSDEYFRGGHSIPWWATGMSLFATGASALSLMAMPAKSYAGNWAFFAISIYFVIALPLSMYFLAPLIRKLNYGTAFEYLEDRFGLSVRMLGSTFFALGQILGRMGTILLFPAAALDAIAGIPMAVSVPIMGIVTIAYTYLGGLSAVIWTDTIQGFVMIASVVGCLILAWTMIDTPTGEIWTTLEDQSKLHIFDWGASLSTENVMTVFLGVIALTLLTIGDQNFVQRVQCTRSLPEAKKAVATQLGVAVPINFLLFALGTALFLFYKSQPAELSPTIKTDGIFPFFAAQELPPGVSGFVIAALLAATMSTISSSLCSVSNLIVEDYYKRFSSGASDAKAVKVGRWAILLIGLFGISSAFYLDSFETPSLWDLFLRVFSIISATTIGTYALGLLSRKANEAGVLTGIVAGMIATYFIAKDETIIFWLYPIYGSFITMAVGYAVSLATGGNKKNIDGLTLATLSQRRGGLDD